MSILLNKKTSQTSDVKENWIAMIAMFLKFIVVIFPFVSFKIGVNILMKMVIRV